MKSRTKRERMWSLLELRGLLEEENSCVHFERTKKHLALHPFYLTNLQTALNEILQSMLNTYDAELKGFVIAYKNPKLLTSLGETFCDTCFIHIDIEADFYLFRPEVGSCLKGIVTKKGLDHIVILVHKTYTVSIPKVDNEEREWLGDLVNIGQEVKCHVTQVDRNIKLPFICATLNIDYLQGCRLSNATHGVDIDNVDTVVEDDSNVHISNEMADKYDSTVVLEDNVVSDRDSKKNRKKHVKKSHQSDSKCALKYKIKTELNDNTANDTTTDIQYKDKQQHKSKRSNTPDINISATNTEIDDVPKKRKKHKNTLKESDSETQVKVKIEKADPIVDTQWTTEGLVNNDITDAYNATLNGHIELCKGTKREYPTTDTAFEPERKRKKKHARKSGESDQDSIRLTEDEKRIADNTTCHINQLDGDLINTKKYKKHKKSKKSLMTMSDSEFEDRVIKIKVEEESDSFLTNSNDSNEIDEKSHSQTSFNHKNAKDIDVFTETFRHIKKEEIDKETKKSTKKRNPAKTSWGSDSESAFKIKKEEMTDNLSKITKHKNKYKADEESIEHAKYRISNVHTSPVKIKVEEQ